MKYTMSSPLEQFPLNYFVSSPAIVKDEKEENILIEKIMTEVSVLTLREGTFHTGQGLIHNSL